MFHLSVYYQQQISLGRYCVHPPFCHFHPPPPSSSMPSHRLPNPIATKPQPNDKKSRSIPRMFIDQYLRIPHKQGHCYRSCQPVFSSVHHPSDMGQSHKQERFRNNSWHRTSLAKTSRQTSWGWWDTGRLRHYVVDAVWECGVDVWVVWWVWWVWCVVDGW